ncbi:hypothetical protein [Pseudobutyrivibrio sp.]|uniref:hypothetical protein n=1 Tax=Pseudobutyrivibrio sp. TaxID=2014367 RepID=UPI0038660DBE
MFLINQHQYKAFYKHTPSLFIIDTPFQLLCATEAIKEFDIVDYLIIAAFDKSEKRNSQVVEMLEDLNLNYRIEYVEDYWIMINSFLQNKESIYNNLDLPNRWLRVFVGNFNALDQWVSASQYAARNASIVFMDDGSSSIDILKNGHGRNVMYELAFFGLWEKCNFDVGPYIFTIYSDIRSKKFITYQNNFSHLLSKRNDSVLHDNNNIYIIGTNLKLYHRAVGVSLSEFEGLLWRKLSELKNEYPNNEIIYIPHGRDTDCTLDGFCKLLNIKYYSMNCAVEYFFVKNNYNAMAVYGFGSTALLTLKLIMPSTIVVNWFLDNKDSRLYKNYLDVAKYYTKHGINLVVIPYPNNSILTKIKRCRIVRIFKSILQRLNF